MHLRPSIILCVILSAMAATMAIDVAATEVALVGIFPGKAVLSVDGSAPHTLAPGQSFGAVKLVSVERDAATIESGGKRERLLLGGQPYAVASDKGGNDAVQSITLIADANGHFVTAGSVNGAPITFLVDTGASAVTLTTQQARQAGINYLEGEPGYTHTANGDVRTWHVKLDRVAVNGLTLQNVDGTILPAESGVALLGMTFLNRLNMTREGSTMILKRRY